jgi:hypothetical protein
MFCCRRAAGIALGGSDLPVRAVAEAGGHAVDRDLPVDQVVLEGPRGFDAAGGFGAQGAGGVAAGDGHGVLDGQRATVEVEPDAGVLDEVRHVSPSDGRNLPTKVALGVPEGATSSQRRVSLVSPLTSGLAV